MQDTKVNRKFLISCLVRTLAMSGCLKPGAHGENFAEQSSTNDILLSKILIISATNDKCLTVCAASENFPQRLLDNNTAYNRTLIWWMK